MLYKKVSQMNHNSLATVSLNVLPKIHGVNVADKSDVQAAKEAKFLSEKRALMA